MDEIILNQEQLNIKRPLVAPLQEEIKQLRLNNSKATTDLNNAQNEYNKLLKTLNPGMNEETKEKLGQRLKSLRNILIKAKATQQKYEQTYKEKAKELNELIEEIAHLEKCIDDCADKL